MENRDISNTLHSSYLTPCSYSRTITGGLYQDMLENYFSPQNEDLQRETGKLVIFIQDGAPPHFCQSVHKALNEKFPNAWIGRGVQSSGLPEVQILPKWTFLWGYVKNIVYGENIRDLQHLRDRITAAIAAWREIKYSLDICRVTNGAHIETN
jgi:hypothetical protein